MLKIKIVRRHSPWQAIAALACFVTAVVAGIAGSLLTAEWILNAQLHPWLHTIGLILLILALPILILGGHCLDLMELKEKSGREDVRRQIREGSRRLNVGVIALLCLFFISPPTVSAQQPSGQVAVPKDEDTSSHSIAISADRERLLLNRIDQLERRLTELETRLKDSTGRENGSIAAVSGKVDSQAFAQESTTTEIASGSATPATRHNSPSDELSFVRDTTFNVTLDGYYGYNFNRPIGGINLLRAYDVQSNSFSLNQAALIIENAVNLENGKRYGLRLDLQYGQATETIQGNAANEPRPQVYRNVWQAYGTYVFDVGNGLTVDLGKYAGSLGYETNYTKDNFNYTRSYYFNFLPFYHLGFRTKYPLTDKVTLMYHLVNGTQQSEDFNGFKSHHLALVLTPNKSISGQINYYFGQEQRDRNPDLNPTLALLPTQPGLSTDVIRPVPSGLLHILDTYYTFNVTDKWTLAFEGDYVIGRVFRDCQPATVWGGAGYARYQWTPGFALAGRFEYLAEKISSDGTLFSGVEQALKENTLTAEYKLAEGLLMRGEYRRDWSNQPFFLTERTGLLKKEQNTATLGLVWWFGPKQGSW